MVVNIRMNYKLYYINVALVCSLNATYNPISSIDKLIKSLPLNLKCLHFSLALLFFTLLLIGLLLSSIILDEISYN